MPPAGNAARERRGRTLDRAGETVGRKLIADEALNEWEHAQLGVAVDERQ